MRQSPRGSEPGDLGIPAAGYVLSGMATESLPGVDVVGGKAHNLARLTSGGAEVPPWIAISSAAFHDFVLEPMGTPDPEEVESWQDRVRSLSLPDSLREEIHRALAEAGLEAGLLAVRSSAIAEDNGTASFAGQFDSRLGVRPDEVERAVVDVWASAANRHALSYGRQLTPMAVVVQSMVDPAVSGVAFGADPVTGDRETVVVSAVWGLGEGLVSGDFDADTYRVRYHSPTPRIDREIINKTHLLRLDPSGGSVREALPPHLSGERPTLNDERVLEIAEETRRLGDAHGGPQDVEWAISEPHGKLWILQARPITALPPAAAGERRIWDNSNIVESYAGVTSPLTFSFARTVYEEVYRQFCAVVGVPPELIERHRHVFANMLGQVRGRVYYNLLNWYRTLALLPGYSVNRSFMERMMGVREKLEDPPAQAATSRRSIDALRMVRMVGRLVRESRGLRHAVPEFHARVDRALLALQGQDLTTWEADRLAALYRSLEERLLRRWQTPLVNDFFAMVWFGVLGRLVESWLPDAPPTLANDLLMHEGGIISAEPAARVQELASHARDNPTVRAHFEAEPDAERLERRIASDPQSAAFLAEVDAYLSRFGERCMGELKLETVTLSENPAFLFQTIRGSMEAPGTPERSAASEPRGARGAAERLVQSRLGALRGRIFATVLTQARARVRDRENLRFERTRVFGVVRRIFLGIGHHLVRVGQLDHPRDIFFLRVEEIFGYVEGTGAGTDLRELVRVRKEEWDGYARLPAPPDRFESIGPVAEENWILPVPEPGLENAGGELLRGIGCCPGVVRAPVRLVRDPQDADGLRGHILVAERTDPGWTLIFPVASGILVERGSLLSHSAIVAREMGIPCIVSIPGLMESLRDGEVVEMDGAVGTVRIAD